MQFFTSTLCVVTTALFSVLSAALSVSEVTGANCNGYTISSSATHSAALTALSHLNAGTTVGSNHYPHRFNNHEGFIFNAGCNPPYYEFPVFRNYIYTGGSPGRDRVVIGSWNGEAASYCDAVTHAGASGNNFKLCANT